MKNKLKIEHFSGYSNQAIVQDFYTSLFVSNIQSLIVGEVEQELVELKKKYKYKVNTNISYGLLKNRIINLLTQSDKDIENIFKELKYLYKKHLIPIRPNRSNPRNKKYKRRYKPKVLKNQKDAI